MDTTSSPARAQFENELAKALIHLYDPDVLRLSPLARLFDLDQREGTTLALQRALNEAIKALKPGEDAPTQSGAWRVYRVLFYRYTEQFTQQEVAADLGLSIRQLRREEKSALTVLADQLWCRYHLRAKTAQLGWDAAPNGESAREGAVTPSQEQELDWLEKTVPSERVYVRELVESALQTARPLLDACGMKVSVALPDAPPPLLANPTTLRQALLHVLAVAAHCAPRGQIHVSLEAPAPSQTHSCLSITARAPSDAATPAVNAEEIEMVRKLMDISGASIEVAANGADGVALGVRVVAPIAEQAPVLVIDDNADTMRLLERYLANSRYRYIGVSDPKKALALEGLPDPRVIVLDVMMPGLDGWELLGQLRTHPKTGRVPIIVCTILPQEQMALALGAAAFLRKPISRHDLLTALDHQMARLAIESC